MAIANHSEREVSGTVPTTTTISVAYGDGIGPEIMDATVRILDAAGARLKYETVEIGEAVYARGHSAGIEPGTWDTLRRNKVFLKAPITTPQGGGFKSLNVTVRKTLGLYANVRPCVSYDPIVPSLHPDMNLVVVRENEEDLYAGIEHRQTDEVYQCLKLITRPGCERIARYAFEYARAYGRKKVTCMTKDNIMKMTDGLFHKVFEEIGEEYSDIEKEHWIIDIGMARAANRPGNFDVILVPNLYGDILSDVTAEVAGSVGLAPSANIGDGYAMFEAIHGSAPRLAGQNAANPSGLLLAAVMMMIHVGQPDVAEKIHNAWLRTLEDGIHTKDIYREGKSAQKVGTKEFADAVIARIGLLPTQMAPVSYVGQPTMQNLGVSTRERKPAVKELVGVDVFVQWRGNPDDLAAKLNAAQSDLNLEMISCRGLKVWPNGLPETFLTDHFRCRYMHQGLKPAQIAELLSKLDAGGVEFVKTEHLYTFDGEAGFSLGQGQ